jgi:hypothetical protein
MFILQTLLLSLAVTVTAQDAQTRILIDRIYSDTVVPPTDSYQSTILLATPGQTGEFSLSFTPQSDSLDLMIRLAGFPMDYAWASVGFGSDMRNSDFIVLHQMPEGIKVHQHTGTGLDYGM